jgi:hypothetical protein
VVHPAAEEPSAKGDEPQVEVIYLYSDDDDEPAQAAGGRVISSISEMVVRSSR